MDVIRATLLQEGAWLNDICVLRLAQLMLRHQQLQHCVALVDSICLADWLAKGRYADALRAPPQCRMQLMPVHHADHWSLLVRCYETRQWLHLDSLGGYHAHYVARLVDALDAHYGGDAFARFSPPLIGQVALWECGLYALMYVWLMLRWPPNSDLAAHCAKYRPALCEENRRLFTEKMLDLLATAA